MPYRTFAWMGSDGSEIGTMATELFREPSKPQLPLSSRKDRRRVVDSARRLVEELRLEREEQYNSLLNASRALSSSPRGVSAATVARAASVVEEAPRVPLTAAAASNPLASAASSHEYHVEDDTTTAITAVESHESQHDEVTSHHEESLPRDIAEFPTDDAYSPEFQVCTADEASESIIVLSERRALSSAIHFESDDEH